MLGEAMSAHGWRKIASATWGRPNDPQIYGDLEVDATRLLVFIEEARRVTGVHVTVTHAVGKAVAQGLAANPHLAGHSADDDSASIDVFFVVSAAGGEEVSGVNVRGADQKSLVDIASELEQRAERVRQGAGGELGMSKHALAATPVWLLRPVLRVASWLTGEKNVDLRRFGMPQRPFGSAMVSSVAMFGVQKAYGPLATLYRVPILALVSEIAPKPVVVGDEIVARPILVMTATMDHRYLDGAHAAKLARSVRAYLEDPFRFELLRGREAAAPTAPS
jgi:pyruvate/2-oxoglutarate dehydrogenase complex dihydrolipoamide acyltransferase (E2) component